MRSFFFFRSWFCSVSICQRVQPRHLELGHLPGHHHASKYVSLVIIWLVLWSSIFCFLLFLVGDDFFILFAMNKRNKKNLTFCNKLFPSFLNGCSFSCSLLLFSFLILQCLLMPARSTLSSVESHGSTPLQPRLACSTGPVVVPLPPLLAVFQALVWTLPRRPSLALHVV